MLDDVGQVVGQGEEVPLYDVTITSGPGGAPVRGPFRVRTLTDIPMAWEQIGIPSFPCTVSPTSQDDGTVGHSGSVSEVACVMHSQTFTGDSEVWFEVGAKFPARYLHVINWPAFTATQIFWETTEAGGVPTLHAATTGIGFRPLPGQRFGVRMVGGHAEYMGPSGQVVARSGELPLSGSYRIQVTFGLLGGEAQELKRVTIRPAEPEICIYSAGMQVEDFGSVQSHIYVEVRRVSLNPSADLADPLLIEGVA